MRPSRYVKFHHSFQTPRPRLQGADFFLLYLRATAMTVIHGDTKSLFPSWLWTGSPRDGLQSRLLSLNFYGTLQDK